VDLLFFVRDSKDKLVHSENMFRYDGNGMQVGAASPAEAHRFDVAANWYLVDALLNNPVAEVQYIFIQDDLRQMLLDYASISAVPPALIARAAQTLLQPGDSAPHDDHMHVRIYCPKSDLRYGCVDFGQLRWHKRDYKYASRIERLPVMEQLLPEGSMPVLPWLWR
jgi:penicillin-insensitive murein endopeptidase